MRVLSLFSGGGLGDYGLELAGMEIVGQVEIDDRCRKLLNLQRPWVPKWKDIRDVKCDSLPEADLVSGGFPCQPYSVAGKKRGEKDDRNLWPEMFRVVREKSPAFVLAENVPGIVPLYLDKVLDDMESVGYSALPLNIPSCAFGADHVRARIWVIAYSEKHHARRLSERKKEKKSRLTVSSTFLGYSPSKRLQDRLFKPMEQPAPLTEFERPSGREVERDFCGMAYGVSDRVHRLQMLGNGQDPRVTEWIGKSIMRFERNGRIDRFTTRINQNRTAGEAAQACSGRVFGRGLFGA